MARNALWLLIVVIVEAIVGWIAVESVKAGVADVSVRQWFAVGIWPVVIVAGTVAFVAWLWRGDRPSRGAKKDRKRINRLEEQVAEHDTLIGVVRAYSAGDLAGVTVPTAAPPPMEPSADDPAMARDMQVLGRIVVRHFVTDLDYVPAAYEFMGLGIPPEETGQAIQRLAEAGWIRPSAYDAPGHADGGFRPTTAGIRELARRTGGTRD